MNVFGYIIAPLDIAAFVSNTGLHPADRQSLTHRDFERRLGKQGHLLVALHRHNCSLAGRGPLSRHINQALGGDCSIRAGLRGTMNRLPWPKTYVAVSATRKAGAKLHERSRRSSLTTIVNKGSKVKRRTSYSLYTILKMLSDH